MPVMSAHCLPTTPATCCHLIQHAAMWHMSQTSCKIPRLSQEGRGSRHVSRLPFSFSKAPTKSVTACRLFCSRAPLPCLLYVAMSLIAVGAGNGVRPPVSPVSPRATPPLSSQTSPTQPKQKATKQKKCCVLLHRKEGKGKVGYKGCWVAAEGRGCRVVARAGSPLPHKHV